MNYGNLQMSDLPDEGKVRCRAYIFGRQSMEMAYQFLSWLEGLFQQSFRCQERGNQTEVQFYKVLIAGGKEAFVLYCRCNLGNPGHNNFYQRHQCL